MDPRRHQPEVINLAEVFYALLRKAWLIIIVALIGGAIGFGYSAFIATPIYSASAMMIVNSTETGDYYTYYNYVTSDQLRSAATLVETYSVIIKSDTVMDKVKSEVKLDDGQEFESVIRGITVEPVNETQIMRISVTATSPDAALKICEKITQVCPDVLVKTVKAGSVETVSKPKTSGVPVSPSVKRNTMMGFMAGFMLVAGLIILFTIIDNKIKGEADIQREKLTLLGVIPTYEKEGR